MAVERLEDEAPPLRQARVQIGRRENGRPSLVVEGVELADAVGKDVTLRFVDDGGVGHWELSVVLVEPVIDVDVLALLEVHPPVADVDDGDES